MKIVAAILILFFAAGCNPAKRLLKNQQGFDRIGNEWAKQHPCANDTISVFKPGRVDSINVKVPVADTAALRRMADSIGKALAKKYNQRIEDCNQQVNESFDIGYQQALYVCGQIKVVQKQPDTLVNNIADKRISKALADENKQLLMDTNAEKDTSAKYLKQRNMGYIIMGIAAILLILFTIIILKKWR